MGTRGRTMVVLMAVSLIGVLFALSAWGLISRISFGKAPREFTRSVAIPEPAPGYWTTPLPADAPIDPRSDAMIDFLIADNSTDYIALAGTQSSGHWGNPIFVAGPRAPRYSIENSCGHRQPTEFRRMSIPRGAEPDPTSDSAMTVYVPERNLVFATWRTRHDKDNDTWSSCGGALYYLTSNGLEGSLRRSNDSRNFGHRGVPPFTYAVRWDEIQRGAIEHVLKVAINTAGVDNVFPMTGSDGDSRDPAAPPEGARLRIKPSVDLAEIRMTPAERTIADALQRYGAVIGDQSGSTVALKVENTVAEGFGHLWDGVLRADSLSGLSLEDFEIVELGYAPPLE